MSFYGQPRLNTCWGLGSQRAGRLNLFDLIRCSKCGRKFRKKDDSPLWYWNGVELEPQCVDCARARHVGCPCRYVERTSHIDERKQ